MQLLSFSSLFTLLLIIYTLSLLLLRSSTKEAVQQRATRTPNNNMLAHKHFNLNASQPQSTHLTDHIAMQLIVN